MRLIVVGKAASGKDYLVNILSRNGYKRDISVTTRLPRKGEADGFDYYYVHKDVFHELSFYEKVNFNGWWYGTLLSSWNNSQVFIMTPSGVSQIRPEDRRDCKVLYLDIDIETRRERLEERSDVDRAERRISADEKDFAEFGDWDYIWTNPEFDEDEVLMLANYVFGE